MKTHEFLQQYLQKYKSLNLQGIGVLSLTEIQSDGESENTIQKITFSYDPKTPEDPELIKFISQVSGKMTTLAAADLEDYLLDARQLLNISKSVHLEGIGTLQKNQYGEIEFQPTNQENEAAYKDIKSMFSKYQKKSSNLDFSEQSRKRITYALIFLGFATFIWLSIYIYKNNSFQFQRKIEKIEKADTLIIASDSTSIKSDSIASDINNVNGKETFRVVLEIANKTRAIKRFADLKEWGHRVGMTTKDSIKFKIFMPFNAPLKDTSYYRDSLSIFFARKVWIETIK